MLTIQDILRAHAAASVERSEPTLDSRLSPYWEGAEEIDRLQARCAALEEALRPLAEMAPHFPREAKYGNRPRSGTVYSCASHGLADAEITVEALHAAAALLAQGRLT